MTDEIESAYKKYSEWDSKLLQQRLGHLSEWSDEYHEIQLALIEEERKKATEADKTGAETEKINEYYNKQIEDENERAEKAKREMNKQTMLVIVGHLKNIASKSVEIFKKVVSTLKNAFSTIDNFIKNTFSEIKNIFEKLFDFNINDALDNLLEIEDAILIYRVSRSPEKYVFNVDVGKMGKQRGEMEVAKLQKQFGTKKVYDPNTGTIGKAYDPLQITENFWFVKGADSDGITVNPLTSAHNFGNLDDLEYFLKKFLEDLGIQIESIKIFVPSFG